MPRNDFMKRALGYSLDAVLASSDTAAKYSSLSRTCPLTPRNSATRATPFHSLSI